MFCAINSLNNFSSVKVLCFILLRKKKMKKYRFILINYGITHYWIKYVTTSCYDVTKNVPKSKLIKLFTTSTSLDLSFEWKQSQQVEPLNRFGPVRSGSVRNRFRTELNRFLRIGSSLWTEWKWKNIKIKFDDFYL
jgi:hypothetical protein